MEKKAAEALKRAVSKAQDYVTSGATQHSGPTKPEKWKVGQRRRGPIYQNVAPGPNYQLGANYQLRGPETEYTLISEYGEHIWRTDVDGLLVHDSWPSVLVESNQTAAEGRDKAPKTSATDSTNEPGAPCVKGRASCRPGPLVSPPPRAGRGAEEPALSKPSGNTWECRDKPEGEWYRCRFPGECTAAHRRLLSPGGKVLEEHTRLAGPGGQRPQDWVDNLRRGDVIKHAGSGYAATITDVGATTISARHHQAGAPCLWDKWLVRDGWRPVQPAEIAGGSAIASAGGRAEPGGQRDHGEAGPPLCPICAYTRSAYITAVAIPRPCIVCGAMTQGRNFATEDSLTAPEGRIQTPELVGTEKTEPIVMGRAQCSECWEEGGRQGESPIHWWLCDRHMQRDKESPKRKHVPHDFSDKYVVRVENSRLYRLCANCGTERTNQTEFASCKPNQEWRHLEDKVTRGLTDKVESLTAAPAAPKPPRLQSRSLSGFGGTWALRDENEAPRPSQEVGSPNRPWELP